VANRLHLLYNRKIIGNQKGFSLIEILVVVGLSAVVVMGNSLFMSDFMQKMEKYSQESSEESDLAVLNTMALNILKKSSLSFNRIQLNDDNKANFFDFYPDMPMSSFSSETRIFTMNSTTKNFYIISSDEARFLSTVFDPVHAYTVDAPPSNVLDDGGATYRGLNSVPDFTNDTGGKSTLKMMSQIFGARWDAGKVFVVTCPTYLRPVSGSTATVSLGTAPRMPSFVGKVLGDDLSLLASSEAGVSINNTHPVTSATYTSLDNFFRTLPTVGGAAPFVKIEPALVNRFELRTNQAYKSGYYDLYLKSWTSDGYKDEIQVALKVKTVTFKRKSITLPIISMEIQK
jgi:prepilin-type N-terminal cleavage/methylation domain-containing protein